MGWVVNGNTYCMKPGHGDDIQKFVSKKAKKEGLFENKSTRNYPLQLVEPYFFAAQIILQILGTLNGAC